MTESDKRSDEWVSEGVALTGFLILGLGVGVFFGQTVAGLFIGLGLGLLSMALLRRRYLEKRL